MHFTGHSGDGGKYLRGNGYWRLFLFVMPALLSVQQRFGVNPPRGYAYGYFKTISLVALLSAPFLVQGILGFFSSRYITIWCCGLFVCSILT